MAKKPEYTEEQKEQARAVLRARVSEIMKDIEFDAMERLERMMTTDESTGLLETQLEDDGFEAAKNFVVAYGHHLIWSYGKPYATNDRKWLNKIKKLRLKM